jgi:F-type H+-transporting ATPase subunit gamma
MATLRDIRRRINSVKSTQQITRAMKMVAAARLRHAQEAVEQARPYAYRLQSVVSSLALRAEKDLHPLLQVREPRRTDLVVVTSDRGLCGGFNSNILRRAMEYINAHAGSKDISLTLLGRKAREFFRRRGFVPHNVHIGISEDITYHSASIVVDELVQDYSQERRDELVFVYNEFKSAIQQKVVVEKLLPFTPIEPDEDKVVIDYLYEPSEGAVLDDLLEKHLGIQVYRILLESSASEHGARMTAMDSATNNADDMIAALTLHYNRARQAAITKELIEIVSGAEALK